VVDERDVAGAQPPDKVLGTPVQPDSTSDNARRRGPALA
jgi:hypothetical protein